ncbi:MAG: A/G-specific adenine glycosylase [Planctomycetes bacterium]|nr:A/G-specific adenine glycosylase [Planctomycetota bacterium]
MPIATDRSSAARRDIGHFSAAHKQSIRRKLLAWYAKHARDLPWRRSRDPYRVWISEIMLQQTQVATVRNYFSRFVRTFPNVRRLAAADEQAVLRLWEGLGYYRRARQLHAAARKIVSEHAGQFPQSVDELRELPGIGRYTAGAIASIAFDQRAPILEANTIRLLSRLIGYRDDPQSSAGQRVLWQVAEDILPQRNAAQFNQALMELGSLVCTPSEPKCDACPLSSLCAASAAGIQHEIPRPKSRQIYTEVREAAVVVRRNGRVLMRQCAPNERWAGLWDFPRFELEADGPLFAAEELMNKLRAQTGIICGPPTLLKTIRHGVTRYRIMLDCYHAPYLAGRVNASNGAVVRWVPVAELPALPLSTTGRRIVSLV